MSLIQQRCWVLPKQKAWLGSPLLMLGRSCSHKLPQQPLARSASSRNADGQPPGFGLYESMGMRKPTSENSFPLPLPPPVEILALGCALPSRLGQRPCFWGRWLAWPGERLIVSCWWSTRGGEERLPVLRCRASLQPQGDGRLAAQFPGLRVVQPTLKGKSAHLEQRFLAISLNWT